MPKPLSPRKKPVVDAFAKFMRAATSKTASRKLDVPRRQFAIGVNMDAIAGAFWIMPRVEREQFEEAIYRRAAEWHRTPAGQRPSIWPIDVRIEPRDADA